ncbi:MAG: PhnD/SsuA/transferrin family substrate-binding protein [Lachnospiraceae bacterium]|nr:PhnD/SsuA/transferrin family substrate-binding protein [Lachnospiraceae bacterium]
MKTRRLCTLLLTGCLLAACARGRNTGGNMPDTSAQDAGPVSIETLRIVTYQTEGADEALTEGLGTFIKNGLQSNGIEVGEVTFTTADPARCAEALIGGNADIVLLPATQYVVYSDSLVKGVLTAGEGTDAEHLTSGGQAGIYAAASERGQAIAQKAASGAEITWEDLDDCVWAVASSSDLAGYIYPNYWLYQNYQKGIPSLSFALTLDETDAIRRAAAGQIDILVCAESTLEAHAAMWSTDLAHQTPIEEELTQIAATGILPGDVLCVGAENEDLSSDKFCEALTEVFQIMAYAEQAQPFFAAYGFTGFMPADTEAYAALLEAMRRASQ